MTWKWVASLVLGVAGCSSTEPTTASTSCSDGARWPRGTDFGFEPSTPADAVACTPHCGPNQASSREPNVLTTDALPSGACSTSEVCAMRAEYLGVCPNGVAGSGGIESFVCRCVSGTWACKRDASRASATAFSCGSGDAGP